MPRVRTPRRDRPDTSRRAPDATGGRWRICNIGGHHAMYRLRPQDRPLRQMIHRARRITSSARVRLALCLLPNEPWSASGAGSASLAWSREADDQGIVHAAGHHRHGHGFGHGFNPRPRRVHDAASSFRRDEARGSARSNAEQLTHASSSERGTAYIALSCSASRPSGPTPRRAPTWTRCGTTRARTAAGGSQWSATTSSRAAVQAAKLVRAASATTTTSQPRALRATARSQIVACCSSCSSDSHHPGGRGRAEARDRAATTPAPARGVYRSGVFANAQTPHI